MANNDSSAIFLKADGKQATRCCLLFHGSGQKQGSLESIQVNRKTGDEDAVLHCLCCPEITMADAGDADGGGTFLTDLFWKSAKNIKMLEYKACREMHNLMFV